MQGGVGTLQCRSRYTGPGATHKALSTQTSSHRLVSTPTQEGGLVVRRARHHQGRRPGLRRVVQAGGVLAAVHAGAVAIRVHPREVGCEGPVDSGLDRGREVPRGVRLPRVQRDDHRGPTDLTTPPANARAVLQAGASPGHEGPRAAAHDVSGDHCGRCDAEQEAGGHVDRIDVRVEGERHDVRGCRSDSGIEGVEASEHVIRVCDRGGYASRVVEPEPRDPEPSADTAHIHLSDIHKRHKVAPYGRAVLCGLQGRLNYLMPLSSLSIACYGYLPPSLKRNT